MISEDTILCIQEILVQNIHTHRQIAEQCGVSRQFVSNVANGKRTLKNQRYKPFELNQENYERCPSCGCRVLMPCLACYLKKVVFPISNEHQEKLTVGLNLRPEHHKRYLQVRAEREKYGIS